MASLWVLPEELGDYTDSEYAYEACVSASYVLWALSGRKYKGLEQTTEEYTIPSYTDYTYHNDVGVLSRLSTTDMRFYPRFNDADSAKFRLRGQPVYRIISISNSAGDLLDGTEYQLENNAVLFHRTGFTGNLTVSYVFGAMPPLAGRMAARAFAIELAKGWAGEADCALPERVTSVSREGVSYTILDNQMFLDDLKTGIYQVDLFLKIANPDKARKKSKVFSPELRRGRHVRATNI